MQWNSGEPWEGQKLWKVPGLGKMLPAFTLFSGKKRRKGKAFIYAFPGFIEIIIPKCIETEDVLKLVWFLTPVM